MSELSLKAEWQGKCPQMASAWEMAEEINLSRLSEEWATVSYLKDWAMLVADNIIQRQGDR